MERHILIVQGNPNEGQEDEFNDWYSNTHLDEVLDIPGFVSAQRYVHVPVSLHHGKAAPEAKHRYIAVYEIEGDLDAAVKAFADTQPQLTPTAAFDPDKVSLVYEPVTEKVVEKPRTPSGSGQSAD
ncbi:hypothetical protein VZC37_22085 [Gordonia sp. LSe1-13]|uniref:EthD family reductase n=1 Tax=Gordonia sesuvii TaxID=3116777 RepID=A0ABU7MJ54_9ACTN|nr:hypothetical protein [Gordonia sp. LSe1-13]